MTAADTIAAMAALRDAEQAAAEGMDTAPILSIATAADSQSGVNRRLTRKRPKVARDNNDYARFARRVLRSYAARIATGDIEALAMLTGLAGEIDTAIQAAVTGLREQHGYSWADIGSRLGISRQAAQQRWGAKP